VTQPAAPVAAAEATRTSDPLTSAGPSPGGARADDVVATNQIRDPQRYRVLGEHGRGGLGRVSRAHDRELGRDVAIKELISRNSVHEVRFMREALITARLEHPGIVPVHEAGRWPDGTPFYAMKLVSGRPLRELIAERTTIEHRIGLLRHVIAVADAIGYAHRRNIIHRDLKPANVIVGDFGETVVIDWGLAKDLSVVDDAMITRGSVSADPVDDLTAAGSVLGTPAYMAPEAKRGEYVDQRADVFALGAILWELCALEKTPPSEPRVRHRMLAGAGIDEDLAIIIDKALDPDPARRYPDAGALAADLKAFESGARIAARNYSLLGMLAHWTRRHRALALSLVVAAAVAVTGVVLYVRNIAIERDRADAALIQAEAARNAALAANTATAAALADRILKNAELLLASDPSAALDVIAGYHGGDGFRRNILRAEAEGRGVARLRATPHTSTILWVQGRADRSVATLGTDGTIAVTSPAGAVQVVARDAARKDTRAWAVQRQLLAYVCGGDRICLVDFAQPVPVIAARFGSDSDGLAFSPSERSLAALAHDGTVTVWDISNLQRPTERYRTRGVGFIVAFLDEQTIATSNTDTITIGTAANPPVQLALPSLNAMDVSHERRALVFGTAQGMAMLVEPTTRRIAGLTKLCDGPISGLQFMPDPDQIAYGCASGNVGIWETRKATHGVLATLQGDADFLVASPDGQELAIGGSGGTFYVLDLRAKILTPYLGHNVRITSVGGPDRHYPFFVSTDSNGSLRVWPRRRALARVALAEPSRLFDAQLLADSTTAVVSSPSASLHVVTPQGVQLLGPHDTAATWLELAPDKTRFAAFGWSGHIELWDGAKPQRPALIEAQETATVRLAFLAADDLVWGGTAKQILRWSSSGGSSTVARFAAPIASFVALPADHTLVVELADGTLWRAALDGATARLATASDKPSVLQLSSDGRWLAVGDVDGELTVYDTARWRATHVLRAAGAIQHIAFSAGNDLIAVATSAGLAYLGRAAAGAPVDHAWNDVAWVSFAAHPRNLAFTPSGDLLMIACHGGVVWFYAPAQDRWLYDPTGVASITEVRSAADGRTAVTADSAGRLLVLDLTAVRAALAEPAAP